MKEISICIIMFFYCFPTVFNALYSTQDNVLVASPTGSGKTICAEFAILKLFADVPKNAKAVYITPYPTLAKQVSTFILSTPSMYTNEVRAFFSF